MERDGGNGDRRVSRKRELKLVENKFSREVTFSKRRNGLFRKASELSLLCGAEIAIIAYLPHANPFAFGAPSADAVLRRFAGAAAAPVGSGLAASASSLSCGGRIGAYSRQDKEAVSRLQEVKSLHLPAAAEGPRRWWEDPIEGMGAEELDQFVERMEMLKAKVQRRVEGKGKAAASTAAPAAAVAAPAPAPAAGEAVGPVEDDITALWDSIIGPDKGEAALLGGGGGTGSSESLSSLFGSSESTLNGQFEWPEMLSSDHLMFDFDLGDMDLWS